MDRQNQPTPKPKTFYHSEHLPKEPNPGSLGTLGTRKAKPRPMSALSFCLFSDLRPSAGALSMGSSGVKWGRNRGEGVGWQKVQTGRIPDRLDREET